MKLWPRQQQKRRIGREHHWYSWYTHTFYTKCHECGRGGGVSLCVCVSPLQETSERKNDSEKYVFLLELYIYNPPLLYLFIPFIYSLYIFIISPNKYNQCNNKSAATNAITLPFLCSHPPFPTLNSTENFTSVFLCVNSACVYCVFMHTRKHAHTHTRTHKWPCFFYFLFFKWTIENLPPFIPIPGSAALTFSFFQSQPRHFFVGVSPPSNRQAPEAHLSFRSRPPPGYRKCDVARGGA